ncbi:hypothetical protein EON63_10410 [archaeon]|nr:MAG: hypothetical protein EON63_10410 [archaeon]
MHLTSPCIILQYTIFLYIIFHAPYVLFRFSISLDELLDGDDIASCPSCTLKIKVIYDDEVLGGFETLVQEYELEQRKRDGVKDEGLVV